MTKCRILQSCSCLTARYHFSHNYGIIDWVALITIGLWLFASQVLNWQCYNVLYNLIMSLVTITYLLLDGLSIGSSSKATNPLDKVVY